MVGYATKLFTVPVSTASAPAGSATILYPVREINSRPMSVGKRRASLYREVALPNAGIAIVWIVLGSMSPCPDTWYPHPVRAVSSTTREVISPQRRRDAELSAEKTKTRSEEGSGFNSCPGCEKTCESWFGLLCAFLCVFASLRGIEVLSCSEFLIPVAAPPPPHPPPPVSRYPPRTTATPPPRDCDPA